MGMNVFLFILKSIIYESRCGMTRKQAREEAFILVFEKQFNEDSLENIMELAVEVRDITPDDYINKVFFGVYEHIDELDGIISSNAIGWKIGRILKTSLAILRLAVFEIKYMEDIPQSVSINEAVELCKKYATKEDASFVTGILASVVKQ